MRQRSKNTLTTRQIDRLWILGGLVLLALGLLIGAQLIPLGSGESGELAVSQWFADRRSPALTTMALTVHYGLGPILAPIIIVAIVVGALLAGQKRLALVAIIVPVVGWGTAKLFKTLWYRPRPPAQQLHALVAESSASFPSGHTAFAAALVATIIAALAVYRIHIPWWGFFLAIVFVTLVGLARIYVGAHYVGDVLSAPLYCWAGVALISPLLRRLMPPLENCGDFNTATPLDSAGATG